MNATILFADNERGIRLYCRQELEADGFRVVLAEDGEEAVNLLNTEEVDLAILDEYMPRCSGRESAGRIKRSHAQLPVILFTADSYFESYKSSQIDATVIKSPDLTDLRAVIAKLLPTTRVNANRGGVAGSTWKSNTIAVNAAFLQEIKEENVKLSTLLISLKAWLGGGPAVYHQRERFIQLLADLRDELAMHFSLEEGYGYFEDAVAAAPELSKNAATLRDEHKTLYLAIDRLVQQAESTRTRIDAFGNILARARAFLDQLQQHEHREHELILRAYDDDFGIGD